MCAASSSSKSCRTLLTAWDISLLEKHLTFYEELASGKRIPATNAQRHFVAVLEEGAKPITQHEIAYTRYLESKAANCQPMKAETPKKVATAKDEKELEDAVEALEEFQLINDQDGKFTKFFEKIKSGYISNISVLRDRVSQTALWAATLAGENEWTRQIERWSAEQFNTLSNVYTQAMDAEYFKGIGDGITHRLLDGGHSIMGSWEAARDALEDDSFWQELRGWGNAYVSDFSSVVGMPLTTLSVESLDYLESTLSNFGIDRNELVDLLSLNAVELASTVVPALGVMMNWSEPERREFAKMIGALGLTSAISANPLMLVLTIVCAARAFHRSKHSEDGPAEWARSVASGGALSGLVLTMSSLIAGPAWVGIVTGILLVLVVKRCGQSIDALAVASGIRLSLLGALRPT